MVWSPATGPLIAYVRDRPAEIHARSITGARVSECELRETLAPSVADDLYVSEIADFDDDDTSISDVPDEFWDPVRRGDRT